MAARIVWSIALGCIAGIFVRSVLPIAWPHVALIAVLGAAALSHFVLDRRPTMLAIALFCCAAGVGILRMDAAALEGSAALNERIGSEVTIVGSIVGEPDVRERNVRLHVRTISRVEGTTEEPVEAGVLAIVPPHTEVAYGDTVRLVGTLRTPEPFDTDAGRVFNYPMFLAKDGILYQLAFAEVEEVVAHGGNPLKKIAIRIKHLYLAGLRSVLPEPAAGLAGGITVGDKRSLGEDLTDAFQKVSLVHIVVLSGYNMTVVINAAAHVFAFVPRSAQFALSGIIVGLFVLMTGGAASATRAGSMALIATYARLSGRDFLAMRVLVVVAAAMVLWNPYLLVFDPGFQLSILATAGLILFTPLIAARIAFVPERFGLREIVASTIGTQLAVLPLLLYQNGLLSLVALPANILTLVFVPAAMLASFVAAIAGLLFGPFGTVFALPALGLLSYIISVAELLSGVPYASVTVPGFSAWLLVPLYGALLALGYARKRNAPRAEPGRA